MKANLFEKLKYIDEHNYTKFTIRFLKVNFFHIFIECLITIYMLEFSAVFSKYFIIDPRNLPTTIIFLILPVLTVTLISIGFGIVCTFVFIDKVYSYSHEIENNKGGILQLYKKITNHYKRDIRNAHAIGTSFYMITSSAIPFILTKICPEIFISKNLFILSIYVLGTSAGIMWNVSGVYRNLRINWCELIKKFNTANIIKDNQKTNFLCFKKNIIWSIISVIIIALWEITIFFLKHSDIDLSTIIKDYNFILLAFTALFSLYIKTFVQKLFMGENEREVFPDLKTILNMDTKADT